MPKDSFLPSPDAFPTYHPETGFLLAVIETPKGCRNKYKFDEDLQAFTLSKVLPAGASFPFDFGFIPRTRAADGDPLDVLVLMDEPAPVGCVVEVRLIGVIEAWQTEKEGQTVRNDRLLAVAQQSTDYESVKSLKDLPEPLLAQIEHFFISYHQMRGTKFKVKDHRNGRHARDLLEKALKQGRREKS